MFGVSLLVILSVFQVPGVICTELTTKIEKVQEQLESVEARLEVTGTKLKNIDEKLDTLLQFFKSQGTYLYVGPGAYSKGSSEILQVKSNEVETVTCQTVPIHPLGDISGYTATKTPKGVLLCGGWDSQSAHYSECYQLNLQTNNWEPHTPLNSKRYLAASVDTPKGWLVMGGHDGSSYVSSSEMLVGGKFVNSITLPTPVIGHCLVKVNASSYLLIGGDITPDNGERSSNKDVYMFDLTGKFTKLSSMNDARYFHSCALMDTNTVVVVGGLGDNFKRLNTVEMFSLSSLSWTYGPALPRVSVMGLLMSHNQQLVYLDGQNQKYLQLEDDKWVEVGTMKMRGQFSAVFVDKPSC